MLNTAAGKIVLIALSVCLVAVVGMFLYTDTSTTAVNDGLSTAVPSNTHSSTDSEQQASDSTPASNTAEDSAQDDKALPIPARQLKKLLSDSPKDDELEQKIAAANQAIADLEKALPDNLNVPDTNNTSTDTVSQETEEIRERLQNIREHLDKKAPQSD